MAGCSLLPGIGRKASTAIIEQNIDPQVAAAPGAPRLPFSIADALTSALLDHQSCDSVASGKAISQA